MNTIHNEAQQPRHGLIRRNQTAALVRAFLFVLINALTGRAKGVDLSHWDEWFNPDAGKEHSDFAIFKLTEGTGWIDPLVDEIWQGVKKALIRGGYHYIRSGMGWTAQAANYLNIAARYSLHFHVVDLEGIGNTYSPTFFADTRRWIDHVRAQTGQKVLLYTNISTYKEFAASIKLQYSDADQWLNDLELWIAYPSTLLLSPPLPTGRSTWTLWQVSWTAEGYGTGTLADLNVFNGDLEQMKAWAGITQPPPDNGGDMSYQLIVTPSVGLNGRGTVGGVVKNIFQKGDILTADDSTTYDGAVWHRIIKWERAGVEQSMAQVPLWASEGKPTDSAYPFLVPVATDPPPTTKPKFEIIYNPAEVDVVLTQQP